jgi:hypothetical protein
VAETVARFGGFVAKYMGDGVLVYFGYPQAHEDDAEQAVRAGLAAAVGALKTHAPLQTRVGIATGLVVVGDLIGSGASQEQAIVGETPNLAARLQVIAEPSALLIVTFRSEFEPPWIGQSHVTALTLNRLAERDVRAMIDNVVGDKPLSLEVRQDIMERTDGVPLFVEEITKAVLEAENEGAAQRAAAVVPSPALAVPASLHGSLMARLDRVGPAKEIAQIGAALGRKFSHRLLAAVVRKPEAEIASALDHLVAAGLLFRQGVPPHATYLF